MVLTSRLPNNCTATTIIRKPNNNCSVEPDNDAANRPPSIEPNISPGINQRVKAQSTDPFWWWVNVDAIEVTTIVARDVPIARWVTTSSGRPFAVNTKIRAGTIIIPPPRPNKPLRKPARAPTDK